MANPLTIEQEKLMRLLSHPQGDIREMGRELFESLGLDHLQGTDLRNHKKYGDSFCYANLNGVDLSNVNLANTNLNQALYNEKTKWPKGFSYQTRGVIFKCLK